MKKSEVPQDDAKMLDGKTQELQYALDENGNYTEVKSVGWEPKNIVMQQAWDEAKEDIIYSLKEIEKGNKSPLYYFMYKNLMDEKILSEYTGFWKITVKKHFKPKVFNNLSDKVLEKYKEVFKLNSIEELKKFSAKSELEKINLKN